MAWPPGAAKPAKPHQCFSLQGAIDARVFDELPSPRKQLLARRLIDPAEVACEFHRVVGGATWPRPLILLFS
jgi:hypothetical protein